MSLYRQDDEASDDRTITAESDSSEVQEFEDTETSYQVENESYRYRSHS